MYYFVMGLLRIKEEERQGLTNHFSASHVLVFRSDFADTWFCLSL